MAATKTRPAGLPPAGATAQPMPPLPGVRVPALLGAALGVAVVYAAFADGAVGIPAESRLQVWIAAIAMPALAALLFHRGLVARVPRRAWLGVALLAAFAAWCGLSILWSIAPDESWAEFNRTVAYALVLVLALLLGSSLPRALERVALGYLGIASVVATYALAGKALPWINGPGIFDLDHAERIARLHQPLGYWNALALFCAMAVPIALRAAAGGARTERARLLSFLALVPLLCATILTYSRGGIIVLLAALAVQLATSSDRTRLAAFAGAGLLASVPAVVLGLALPDLVDNGVAQSARADDGVLFLAGLVLGVVAAVALFRPLTRLGERLAARSGAPLGRRFALAACLLGLIALIGGAAISEGGLGGEVKRQVRDVTERRFDPQTPGRILSTNSGNRTDWWNEALGAARDEPVAGYGAGSFRLVHLKYRKDALEVRQPHDLPLQFLAETGVIGAGLGLGGLVLLGLAASAGALGRVGERERGFGIALLAATTAWGLHLFVDWDWDFPALMLPALVFLGVLAAIPREAPARPSVWRARPSMSGGAMSFGLVLLAACALLCLVIASAVLPALAKTRADDALAGSVTRDRADLEQAAEDAAAADRLNPLSVDALITGSAVAESRGQYARAAKLLADAAARQPDNPEVWNGLSRLELLFDNRPAAYRTALRALREDRFNQASLFLYLVTFTDERRSASATGTPLPEKLPKPAAARPAPQPSTPAAPTTPTPTPTPAPAPAPTPAPAPQPQKFRSTG
jgi:hypothetical protein